MGGKSSSRTTTDASTNVNTETNTTIGNIGLSGKDTVELAAVISEGINFNSRALANARTAQASDFPRGVSGPVAEVPKQAGLTPIVIISGLAAVGLVVLLARG